MSKYGRVKKKKEKKETNKRREIDGEKEDEPYCQCLKHVKRKGEKRGKK